MRKIMIKLIHWYQHLFQGKQPTCRFRPTCSHYAIDAYTHHNFFYATILTVWRILRCNPLVKGGYDPIPKFKKELKFQLQHEKECECAKKDDVNE